MSQSSFGPLVVGNGIALHRQLFLCLRDQIVRGTYRPGDLLPNEAQLEQMFGVSRITVRRALGDLEAEGILARKQRVGTFVRSDFRPSRRAASLGLLDTLQDSALEVSAAELLYARRELPPLDIAKQLGLEARVPAVHTRRRRVVDGHPLVVSEAWAPASLLDGVSDTALRKNLLYQLLLVQRIEFGRVIQEIAAEPADPEHARLLGMDIGEPVLRITRLLHNVDDVAIQYVTARYVANRTSVLSETGIDTVGTLANGRISHRKPTTR